jgi:hypothetical protein
MFAMKRGFLAASLALFLSSCSSEDPCDEQAGSVLCGYCDQDAATSSNPHAGACRYCAAGTTCSGDVCSEALTCLAPDDGGGGNTCGDGPTCINNLCSPGLWCCLPGHSCNTGACGCN